LGRAGAIQPTSCAHKGHCSAIADIGPFNRTLTAQFYNLPAEFAQANSSLFCGSLSNDPESNEPQTFSNPLNPQNRTLANCSYRDVSDNVGDRANDARAALDQIQGIAADGNFGACNLSLTVFSQSPLDFGTNVAHFIVNLSGVFALNKSILLRLSPLMPSNALSVIFTNYLGQQARVTKMDGKCFELKNVDGSLLSTADFTIGPGRSTLFASFKYFPTSPKCAEYVSVLRPNYAYGYSPAFDLAGFPANFSSELLLNFSMAATGYAHPFGATAVNLSAEPDSGQNVALVTTPVQVSTVSGSVEGSSEVRFPTNPLALVAFNNIRTPSSSGYTSFNVSLSKSPNLNKAVPPASALLKRFAASVASDDKLNASIPPGSSSVQIGLYYGSLRTRYSICPSIKNAYNTLSRNFEKVGADKIPAVTGIPINASFLAAVDLPGTGDYKQFYNASMQDFICKDPVRCTVTSSAETDSLVCEECGQRNQLACSAEPRCGDAEVSNQRNYTVNSSGQCVCGAVGMPCCDGETCDTAADPSRIACNRYGSTPPFKCENCGAAGQIACDSGGYAGTGCYGCSVRSGSVCANCGGDGQKICNKNLI